ncbi:MAG TPA: molybdate ABC transporter substrate-binding protein [Thermoanaerobaculia bacterium]|nr:molybdate ABC transporter substrate-binding protein [Thermoanaerobaculia bacterium]
MISRKIAAAALVLLAPGARAAKTPSLTVAAAANVRPALEELRAAFEARTGTRVVVSYGASGILARQIEEGAPFDLFLSADAGFVAALESKGRIVPGSRAPYAVGALVVVTARGRPGISSVRDLANPALRRIALANARTAPYGRAAMGVLENLGLSETLRPRLVFAETVRDALRYVETGDADAGFAAESEARGSGLSKYTIPSNLYPPIRQELAIVAGGAHAADAAAFSNFLRAAAGREVWARYGYRLP